MFSFAQSTPALGGGGGGLQKPLFGATPSSASGAAGATPFGSSLFGSTPSQSPSVLNVPIFSSTPTPTSTSTPAQTQTQTPAAMPSFFGTSTSTPNYFGSATPAPTYTPAQGFSTQMAPATYTAGTPLPEKDVQSIALAYYDHPANPHNRFRHLFYNVLDPSAPRSKPPLVDDSRWRAALDDIAAVAPTPAIRERLWPFVAYGFKDLAERAKLQDAAVQANEERLAQLEEQVRAVRRRFETETRARIDNCAARFATLRHRLLKVMHSIELLECRAFRGVPITREEITLAAKLQDLCRELQPPTAELPRKLDQLDSLASSCGPVANNNTLVPARVDEESLQRMQQLLQHQTEALAKLLDVLRRDARDSEILEQRVKKANASVGGGDASAGSRMYVS